MKAVQGASWLRWSEAFPASDAVGGVVGVADRILQQATQAENKKAFLASVLSELATEFAAQWAAIRTRSPHWTTAATWGRPPAEAVPDAACNEAQDRDAAGFLPPEGPAGIGTLISPLHDRGSEVLVLCGRTVDGSSLPHLLAAARAVGHGLAILEVRSRQTLRAERLKATLDVAGAFARTRETKPLLELIAVGGLPAARCRPREHLHLES